MLTSLGKVLRVIRMDKELLLKDMADRLGVKPSYVSSIENGKRRPSENFVQSLRDALLLTDDEYQKVREAYIETIQELSLKLDSDEPHQMDLALKLARSFNDLTPTQTEAIKKIMDSR